MASENQPEVTVNKLTEGAFLVCTPHGNVLLGCPPEILKRILAMHLAMPDTVVVPATLHHFHSSQASLEFPLYHFLFVQRGLERKRKYQVVAGPAQCKGLEELLRVTVVGPTDKEMAAVGLAPALAKEIYLETNHLALKNSETHKALKIREMVNFYPLKNGDRCIVYEKRGSMPDLYIERGGDARFRVLYGEDAYDIDLTVTEEQLPNYKLPHKKPMDRSPGKFNVTILGRSNGFDPNDPANGYLLNLDGKVVVWDGPAYLHQHLRQLKLDPDDIEAFILSHVHEDHIDVVESLRKKPFELYATPEVYFSLLVKLRAVYGCSEAEARNFHKFHPIDVSKPMTICGATFEFFHSVHAIPAVGARISKKIGDKTGILHISGDHLAQDVIEQMRKEGGMTPRRYQFVKGLLRGDESLVLMDAGGGLIHGNYKDYVDWPGRIGYMHTGLIQEKLPKGKELVKSGQVMSVI